MVVIISFKSGYLAGQVKYITRFLRYIGVCWTGVLLGNVGNIVEISENIIK